MTTEMKKVDQQHLPTQSNGGDAVDNILKETSRSNPRLFFKKGKYYISEDEIPLGHEYVAFALDWTRGWVKWHDGNIVDARHMGRVADG
jgi:beta-lactamase class D